MVDDFFKYLKYDIQQQQSRSIDDMRTYYYRPKKSTYNYDKHSMMYVSDKLSIKFFYD